MVLNTTKAKLMHHNLGIFSLRIVLLLQICAVYSQSTLLEPDRTNYIDLLSTRPSESSFQDRFVPTTRRSINDRVTQRSTRRPSETSSNFIPDPGSQRYGTTRSPYDNERRPWTTTTFRSHIPEESEMVQLSPSVNLTIEDFKGSVLNIIWKKGRAFNEATLAAKNLRDFKITFTCNATFPVKWTSKGSFGTEQWEMDETYTFISNNGNRYSENRMYSYSLHSIFLRLKYDKDDAVPTRQILFCGSSLRRYGTQRVESTIIELIKTENSSLIFKVPLDLTLQEDLSGREPFYSEPLGTNDGCLLDLQWKQQRELFECTSETFQNLTIDFEGKNCFDFASCERKFTKAPTCYNPGLWRYSKSSSVSDIWQPNNPPPAGIIYCKKLNETSDMNTVALPFFHSLPRICPQDDLGGRLQLYIVNNNNRLDTDHLSQHFMSFCTTKDSSQDLQQQPNVEINRGSYLVYAGENVTVSCIASFYHFSFGTRIWLKKGAFINEIAVVDNPTTVPNRAQGCFNYTAKVFVKDKDVTEIICENFLKQSSTSVTKSMPVYVLEPKKLTFVGGVNQVALWNYSGQPDFSLRCEAEGDPRPTISWRKQGKEIPSIIQQFYFNNGSASELKFPRVRDERSLSELHGTYTCQAENRLDKIETTFHVEHTSNTSTLPVVINQVEVAEKVEESGSLWYVWAIIIPLFILAVVGIIGFLVWIIKKQNKKLRLLSKAEVDEFNFGRPEYLQHHSSSEEVNNYAPYLPYNQGYEISKEQLEIEPNAVLGSGAYAIVLKGKVHQGANRSPVNAAIKTAKPLDDISYFKALLSELKIMGFIGSHKNIVNLIGAHTRNIQNKEIFIAIEYCDKGNLLTYVRDNRFRFTNLLTEEHEFPKDLVITRDNYVYPDREGPNTITLLKWAEEIASGMAFLSQKKVIHGDLAARNILLTEHLVAKIGDFGLSRQLFEYANYIKKQQSPLPWKWLAIECLQDMRFSVKSDVWAYAVLLYEIFSLGRVPFPGHSYNDEFLDALVNGKRPNKPAYATNSIFDLMSNCWNENSNERPTFTYIQEFFERLLNDIVPAEYMDLHEKLTLSPSEPQMPQSDSSGYINTGTRTNSIYRPDKETSGGKQETLFSLNPKNITARFKKS